MLVRRLAQWSQSRDRVLANDRRQLIAVARHEAVFDVMSALCVFPTSLTSSVAMDLETASLLRAYQAATHRSIRMNANPPGVCDAIS